MEAEKQPGRCPMKSIYLILTRSESVPSRLIGHFTNEPFTHVSISFDPASAVMVSFARRYPHLPLPAGLVEEHMDGGFYRNQGNIPCAVLKLEVDESTYWRAKDRVDGMLVRRREYRYSVLGLLACRMGIEAEIPGHYFCSQFVAEILEDTCHVKLPCPPSLMHPADYLEMDCFRCEFCGGLRDYLAGAA